MGRAVLDACQYYDGSSQLCFNNGQCQPSQQNEKQYTCICAAGYRGTHCETTARAFTFFAIHPR